MSVEAKLAPKVFFSLGVKANVNVCCVKWTNAFELFFSWMQKCFFFFFLSFLSSSSHSQDPRLDSGEEAFTRLQIRLRLRLPSTRETQTCLPLPLHFNKGPFPLLSVYFQLYNANCWQDRLNFYWWWGLNRGPLVSEPTALPTAPLPIAICSHLLVCACAWILAQW